MASPQTRMNTGRKPLPASTLIAACRKRPKRAKSGKIVTKTALLRTEKQPSIGAAAVEFRSSE
jgi:hypothetical protein